MDDTDYSRYVGDISFAQSRKIGVLITQLCKAKLVFGSVIGKNQTAGTNASFNFDYADLPALNVLTTAVLAHYNLLTTNLPIVLPSGKCIMRTRLYHASEQWLQASCPLILKDLTSQQMGSAKSYARRYLKAGILDVAAAGEDDDGTKATEAQRLFDQQRKILKFLKMPDNEFLNYLEDNKQEKEDGKDVSGNSQETTQQDSQASKAPKENDGN